MPYEADSVLIGKMKKISVIIPTLNAAKYVDKLLNALIDQTIVLYEIIVIDSSSDDGTVIVCKKYDLVKVISINREHFDHGATRNLGVNLAQGDYILFMTQDACPADRHYIENLLRPFADDKIAMVSGCQIPHASVRTSERLTREFNYPPKDCIRDKNDIKRLGIKTFFASDVCAAYNKMIFKKTGGFEEPILINEDMMIAAKFIFNDYKIAYASDAKVLHSHNYTLKQQFMRNFDIGVSLKQYEHYFTNISADREGVKMVRYVIHNLLANHKFVALIYYVLESFFKLAGNKLGKNYHRLPPCMIKYFTMNKNYWQSHFKAF